jgi:hypothetical protein
MTQTPPMTERVEFSSASREFINAYYKATKTDITDVYAKIQTMRNAVGQEVLVTSYDGCDCPDDELRALEYYYLMLSGIDE